MAVRDGSTLRPLLLVDDEQALLAATQKRIVRALPKARLLTFAGGEEALAATGGIHLGMAILDIDMSGMNGIELAEQLRARAPELPILFVTGTSQADLEDHLSGLGVVGCFRKPVGGQALIDAILAHALCT